MFRAPSQSFGQMQMGQVSGPSLEEVLSQRGFKVPEMKTGVQASISLLYKDPITGKMISGGPHAASHANAMSKFYEQNPEALKIAKQHQKDQQYNPSGGGGLHQGPLGPPQEIMPQPIQFSNGRPMSGTGQPTTPDPNSIRLSRGDGGTLPPGYYQEPPRRPGGMENLPASLGGQIRPIPYSPPSQMGGGFGGQMGGGIGGLQQFMQFMQMMMQMFQQFNSGGQGGIGGFRSPRSGFGGGSPYGPY